MKQWPRRKASVGLLAIARTFLYSLDHLTVGGTSPPIAIINLRKLPTDLPTDHLMAAAPPLRCSQGHLNLCQRLM